MKRIVSAAMLAVGLSTGVGLAADLPVKAVPAPVVRPPDWDIAFGGALMTDYEFRGITQSKHKGSVAAYSELRYNVNPTLQLYYGNSGESIDFANHAASEIDFYGGFRPTLGASAFDFGLWYYYYPGGLTFNGLGSAATCTNGFFSGIGPACNTAKGNQSFWEVYGKDTYTFNDSVALTGDVYYSPSWLNSGAYGLYASGILKLTAPATWLPNGIGAFVTGELGYYWFGTTDAFYGTPTFPGGIKYPDYLTWNIGLDFTWKVFTLDLRYWDTNLSRANCNVLTADQSGGFNPSNISATNPDGLGSSWCGATFVAKVAADVTLNANIK